ncbi:MAG: hypothetical protein FJ271_10115 [Planctomycetes bacterium]|nr:hypothetical protein [Planctomycetota bacterium]
MSRSISIKTWLFSGGLGVLLAASPACAQPCSVQAGFTFNLQSHGGQCTLGPWYSYFPYDAYFQTPAPVCGYPNWPTPFPPAQAAPANQRGQQNQAASDRMGYAPYQGQYPGQWPNQTVGYRYGMQSAIDFR